MHIFWKISQWDQWVNSDYMETDFCEFILIPVSFFYTLHPLTPPEKLAKQKDENCPLP